MYAFKDKVSEKLSRFFPESTTSPSIDRQSQARSYVKGAKSLTSYISNIIPSIGFDGSRSDKNRHEFKLIPSQPVRYKSLNSKSQDELLDNCVLSNTETETNQARAVLEKDEIVNGNSSEVFEEAVNRSISTKHLPNLMDESAFISPELYEFLFSSIPNIVKGCQWVLMYSTVKHGISLRTLIRRSGSLSGPCLLIVGDKQGSIFGGLLDCPLKPTPKRKYQGTNQTFVFTTRYGEPRLFRPTGANRYYYLCLDELLAMGGGGNFALCLDGDLLNGTSGQCETFGNMCLAHKPEFELKNVELWGFTHASQYLS